MLGRLRGRRHPATVARFRSPLPQGHVFQPSGDRFYVISSQAVTMDGTMSYEGQLLQPAASDFHVWIVDPRNLAREILCCALQAAAPSLILHGHECCDMIRTSADQRGAIILSVGNSPIRGTRVENDLLSLACTLPDVPVIVMSICDGPGEVRHALTLGARGFFSTSLNVEMLVAAIQLVLTGGIFLPPNVALSVATTVREGPLSLE